MFVTATTFAESPAEDLHWIEIEIRNDPVVAYINMLINEHLTSASIRSFIDDVLEGKTPTLRYDTRNGGLAQMGFDIGRDDDHIYFEVRSSEDRKSPTSYTLVPLKETLCALTSLVDQLTKYEAEQAKN